MNALERDLELQLRRIAVEVRKDVLRMISMADSGHLGSSFSCVDILVYLYFYLMRVNPKLPDWMERDRFVLSKGHACPSLYAVLARKGYFEREELWNYRKLGSLLQGHPLYINTLGIDAPSGSLGMGAGISCGMAMALKSLSPDSKVYCLLGDGELQEGSCWEAFMTASHWKLDNLYLVIDRNGQQMEGHTEAIKALEPLKEKLESFGLLCFEVDGHDFNMIHDTFMRASSSKGFPKAIIAHTKWGRGITLAEKGGIPVKASLSRNEVTLLLDELNKESMVLSEEGR
ncbi:MAG: transketolase [Acetomicrobium flavidum]|uniref:transketolase n=1 Tax=Acetomicrobium flavidum TaxID=49896 RepID=UPI0016AC7A1A|nr:transketolase [Acetomicrobium flavidum]